MKFGREDYDRIHDSHGLIPDDEPVFLIRGQDALAPGILEEYAARADRNGRPEIARSVRNQASDMRQWQRTRAKKMPDLPGE